MTATKRPSRSNSPPPDISSLTGKLRTAWSISASAQTRVRKPRKKPGTCVICSSSERQTATAHSPGSKVRAGTRNGNGNLAAGSARKTATGRCGGRKLTVSSVGTGRKVCATVRPDKGPGRFAVTIRPSASQTRPLLSSESTRTRWRPTVDPRSAKNSAICSSEPRCVMRGSRTGPTSGSRTASFSAGFSGFIKLPTTRIEPAMTASTAT